MLRRNFLVSAAAAAMSLGAQPSMQRTFVAVIPRGEKDASGVRVNKSGVPVKSYTFSVEADPRKVDALADGNGGLTGLLRLRSEVNGDERQPVIFDANGARANADGKIAGSTLMDLSPNGFYATQADPRRVPSVVNVAGQNLVRFDGRLQKLDIPGLDSRFVSAESGHTVFIELALSTALDPTSGSTRNNILQVGDTEEASIDICATRATRTAPARILTRSGAEGMALSKSVSVPRTPDQRILLVERVLPGGAEVKEDDTGALLIGLNQVAKFKKQPDQVVVDTGRFDSRYKATIGGENAFTKEARKDQRGLSGDIGSLVVYPRPLSDAELFGICGVFNRVRGQSILPTALNLVTVIDPANINRIPEIDRTGMIVITEEQNRELCAERGLDPDKFLCVRQPLHPMLASQLQPGIEPLVLVPSVETVGLSMFGSAPPERTVLPEITLQ
jgi:hypothetical protein